MMQIDAALGLGRDAATLTFAQISLRGVIVFVAALVIVRCGDRRFLSQKTAFDVHSALARREFIGVGPPPQRRRGWNSDELHSHIRGRAEATVRILIAVAALRSLNVLPGYNAVSVTGAKWQDWRGTNDQPRAHRFPCNPQIAGRDLPDYAANPSNLRQQLLENLAATDQLPFHVNYADELFEDCGGIEAARKGIEEVTLRQTPGGTLTYAAVQIPWRETVLVGYVRAWEAVERRLQDRVNQENAIQLAERIAGFRSNAPTDSIETVMDVAYDAKRSTELVSLPGPMSLPGFEAFLGQLHIAR
jgi:hypothetical protein